MTQLNDLQSILLSAAAQRDSGSILPVPDSVAEAGARLTRALNALTKRDLVEQRQTSSKDELHHTEADVAYGLFITPAGMAAIGIGEGEGGSPAPVPSTPPRDRTGTKAANVTALLQRAEGATLAELIAVTGWLPHTTRAALTGLRKKGHVIERTKRDDETCYRIVAAAA